MIELDPSVFFSFFFYLLIPFIFGYLAKKLRMQPLIGYIIGGIILGNVFTGLVPKETIHQLANVGIIFLLFAVGLEVNFQKILSLKKFILIGGSLQILLTMFFIALVSPFFGFTLFQSVLVGIALSCSSTALVAKIIQEKGEESSFIGEVALGILMFQDLAFIPFVIIFKYLQGEGTSFIAVTQEIVLAMAASALILTSMVYFGQKIIPAIFDRVAKGSRELLNLFILVFIFFVCFASSFVGVPVFVSAFIAGVLVSQTTQHYHIFSQIRPMRDLMAIIFFVYVGTSIPIDKTIPLIFPTLIFGALIIIIKIAVLLFVFSYFKLNSRITFYLSLFLFQVSEIAFILISLAFVNNIINSDQYVMLTGAVLMSLLLTPVLISNKEKLFKFIRAFVKKNIHPLYLFIRQRLDVDTSPIDVMQMKGHVVICGYGRVGAQVGKALTHANIPFIAIDFNYASVQKARKGGVHIIYGDATDMDILDFAETENAVTLVSAVPDRFGQEAIILHAKKLNPNIVIISRIHEHNANKRMRDLGADVIVEPELEASLSIIKKIFFLKKMTQDEIVRKLRHFKIEQGIG